MGGFAMTCFGCVLSVAVFFSCFIAKLEAKTLKITSNPTGLTYVKPGENITLDITYNYTGSQVVQVEWSNDSKLLIRKGGGGVFRFENRAYLNGVNFVLTNPDQRDNGKYTVQLKADDVVSTYTVHFVVIIQVQPVAKIECHGKNNTNFYCECKTDVGNPRPQAYWTNGGKMTGSKGNWTKKLTLANITKDHSPKYTCHVQSHDLKDKKRITFEKPKSVSFKSSVPGNGEVTLTCKAESVLPVTYNITYLGIKITIDVDGTVVDHDGDGKITLEIRFGFYRCVASNIFGESDNFNISLKKEEKQTSPTNSTSTIPTTTNNNSTITAKGSESDSLGVGAIVGIVIGVLVVIVIAIVVVWFLVCKSKEKEGVGSGSSGGSSVPKDDGDYETVDKSKVKRGDGAGPSNDSSPPEDADTMPPVYAVVDKNKKKKKPAAVQPTSVTYASLDPVALQPDSSKMHDRTREETNYASINLDNIQSDLV